MPVIHDPITLSKPAPVEKPSNNGTPLLRIDRLSFSYPDGRAALHEVSLQVYRGEKVALTGPNGAGKSTLMMHLNGILAGEGMIEVAGTPVTGSNLPLIRARVGLVFQNPDDQLFSPTVFEDVAFGPLHMGFPENEVRTRVAQALAQVGMQDFGERLSHHLSTGEKKRIAIATVLSMSPEILVLDEPTSGLDPRARRGLLRLLAELPITMLVSTHDMRMVRTLFPRMVIIDGGRIVADGRTEVLMEDVDLLETHGLEPSG
jgi:cobalt transport protein ATP-binding subunit